jgi:hypothetical protein
MKRGIKYLVILWPFPILVYLVFITLSSQAKVAEELIEANGLKWGKGDEQITIKIKESSLGEQKTFEILPVGKNRESQEIFLLTINEDMFGGGFVKAVQADDDQELVVIAWGSHEEQESFLLDHREGEIRKTPFNKASKDIQNLAMEWHQAYVMNGMTLSVFMIFAVIYYILVGIIWMTVKIIKKGRK